MASCSDDDDPSLLNPLVEGTDYFAQYAITSQSLTLNPSGYSPLAASLELEFDQPVQAQIRVVGKHGTKSDVITPMTSLDDEQNITILGLYADYSNTLELTLYDAQGNDLGSSAVNLQTASLHEALPQITIDVNQEPKEEGMTLVGYKGHAGEDRPHRPFIFDEFGDIRWFLDYATHDELHSLNFGNCVHRLQNGNFFFADSYNHKLYEIDMFGETLNEWSMPGYLHHHDVIEKPDGNFLLTVDKEGLATIEDFIIEIDRNSGQVIREWDLRESLQQHRITITDDPVDWIHVNGITYDESDNTIIISGRTQAVVKLDMENNVKWILAPHLDWEEAGNGVDLSTKLLQPLDASGQPITDQLLLEGYGEHPDFEWPWLHHSPKLTPHGTMFVFDNGSTRNYYDDPAYSRAVEYRIDEENMTIEEVWQYGEERGLETFSSLGSDVDYHSDLGHMIFSPGSIQFPELVGKIVEVDHATSEVVFEATLRAPQTLYIFTYHQSERLTLYP